MKEELCDIVRLLILGFDDPEGVSEPIYKGTLSLIEYVFGLKCSKLFSDTVDACEDRYYIGEGEGEQLFNKILMEKI